MKCSGQPSYAPCSNFSLSSCTRFSPQISTPAAIASRTREASFIFVARAKAHVRRSAASDGGTSATRLCFLRFLQYCSFSPVYLKFFNCYCLKIICMPSRISPSRTRTYSPVCRISALQRSAMPARRTYTNVPFSSRCRALSGIFIPALGHRYAECGAARVDNVLKPVTAAEHRLSVFCGNDCRAHLVRERDRYAHARRSLSVSGVSAMKYQPPETILPTAPLRNKRLGRAYLLERACLQTVNKGAEYPGLGRVCKAAHFALVGLRAAGQLKVRQVIVEHALLDGYDASAGHSVAWLVRKGTRRRRHRL